MSQLIKQEDMMSLKMEDNNDHYLFNSLLAIGHLDHNPYADDDHEHFSFLKQEKVQEQSSDDHIESIINDIDSFINIRTTPLHELLRYVQQYYDLSKSVKLKLSKQLKKRKLILKRQIAKKRLPIKEKSVQLIEPEEMKDEQNIKIQENGISSIIFDDESVETKKKKRNRMSAQKSRDRKKQYVKEMEKMNKDLRKRIEEINSNKIQQLKPASRDFLKVLLCLGITCFLNTNQAVNCPNDTLIEEQRPSSETVCHSDPMEVIPKVDLDSCKKLLPLKEQILLEDALSSINPSFPFDELKDSQNQVICIKSSTLNNVQPKSTTFLGKKSTDSYRGP